MQASQHHCASVVSTNSHNLHLRAISVSLMCNVSVALHQCRNAVRCLLVLYFCSFSMLFCVSLCSLLLCLSLFAHLCLY